MGGVRGRGANRASWSLTGAATSTSTGACCAGAASPHASPAAASHGSGLGKVRWVVERGFAWLHAFKRLRTRYERRADTHLGLLQLVCALICHRRLAQAFRNEL